MLIMRESIRKKNGSSRIICLKPSRNPNIKECVGLLNHWKEGEKMTQKDILWYAIQGSHAHFEEYQQMKKAAIKQGAFQYTINLIQNEIDKSYEDLCDLCTLYNKEGE